MNSLVPELESIATIMRDKFNNKVDPLKEDFSSEGKPSGL